MSEQQRIFLTVLSCMAVLIGWQWLMTKNMPSPPPPAPLADQPPLAQAPLDLPSEGSSSDKVVLSEIRQSFETPLIKGEISNHSAALTRLDLLAYNEKFSKRDAPHPVSLVAQQPQGRGTQGRIDWKLGGTSGPPALAFVSGASGSDGLHLAGRHGDFQVEVEVRPRRDTYALDYVLRAVNKGPKPQSAGARVVLSLMPVGQEEKHFLAPPSDPLHAVCYVDGTLERKQLGQVKTEAWTAAGPARWAALDRQYFVVALVPHLDNQENQGRCTVQGFGETLAVDFDFQNETLEPGGRWEKHFSLYLGPKRDDYLSAVSSQLTYVIDYTIWHIPLGFLARPMVFLLKWFHQWTESWGMAIVLLTLVIKTLLFPVTYRSSVSMRKLQNLKPELDRIKKQFAEDREKQQMEQLKLFREKGVNPLGGCLPMLLQMPVWIALYRTLWSAVDLYQQSFLWLPDLTAKEPFPILALAVGAVTMLQQKMTPMASDSQQARIMLYMMPMMLTLFMVALPSGLVLYILVNSVLTIIQQMAINRQTVALQ